MEKIPLFDGHCDTISRCYVPQSPHYNGGALGSNRGHLDLERTGAAFGPYAQFFALFAQPSTWPGKGVEEMFREEYALFRREMAANAGRVVHCRTAAQAEEANARGLAAAFLSVEGAELLGCSLAGLEEAWRLGVRAVNLTWNFENALSGSNCESPQKGLTPLGREFVREMFRLGMVVDVSHLSDPGFWDVAELAAQAGKPFFASHSNSRALCPHKRNLTDAQFTAIIENQGVAGLNMCRDFLGPHPGVEDLIAQVEHWCALGGAAHVAIGGDWDGCDLCPGMAGITDIRLLYEGLLRRNYREDDVRGMFYHNMMRVVRDVCTM